MGLGRLLAETANRLGYSVAVLDIKEPDEGTDVFEETWGVNWYKCDVSSLDAVRQVATTIEKDIGTPTILINNAAAAIVGKSLLKTESSKSQNTIQVNLQAHFNTLHTFLPSILSSPNGGHIITISSILAHFAPANLTSYAASKAGASTLHRSLEMEIRALSKQHLVKTILAETGQLDTDMFHGVETPSKFLAPIVEANELAKKILEKVVNGDSGVIRMPAYAKAVSWYALLPAGMQRAVRWWSGVDTAMWDVGK